MEQVLSGGVTGVTPKQTKTGKGYWVARTDAGQFINIWDYEQKLNVDKYVNQGPVELKVNADQRGDKTFYGFVAIRPINGTTPRSEAVTEAPVASQGASEKDVKIGRMNAASSAFHFAAARDLTIEQGFELADEIYAYTQNPLPPNEAEVVEKIKTELDATEEIPW